MFKYRLNQTAEGWSITEISSGKELAGYPDEPWNETIKNDFVTGMILRELEIDTKDVEDGETGRSIDHYWDTPEPEEREWTLEGHETVVRRMAYCVKARTREEAEEKVALGQHVWTHEIEGYENTEHVADGDMSNYEVQINGNFENYLGSILDNEEEKAAAEAERKRPKFCEQTVRTCMYGYDKCDARTREVYCKTGCNNKCPNFAFEDLGDHTHVCNDSVYGDNKCADCGKHLCSRHSHACPVNGVIRCAFCAARHRTEVHGGFANPSEKYYGGER